MLLLYTMHRMWGLFPRTERRKAKLRNGTSEYIETHNFPHTLFKGAKVIQAVFLLYMKGSLKHSTMRFSALAASLYIFILPQPIVIDEQAFASSFISLDHSPIVGSCPHPVRGVDKIVRSRLMIARL